MFYECFVFILGEPDLILPDDDDYYVMFLRCCKWYPKSAFSRVSTKQKNIKYV